METSGAEFEVQFDWSAAEERQPFAANQFAAQLGMPVTHGDSYVPDGIYVVFGHALTPLFSALGGPAGEKRLAVDVAARFYLTRDRCQELVDVLTATLDQYDQIVSNGQGGETE